MGYYVKIHPDNPQMKQLQNVAKILMDGGVAILPTDTIYCLAASSTSTKGLKKMASLKQKQLEKSDFSFIVEDFSQISQYTKVFDNSTFKLMKRSLPGPYTFILEASAQVAKIFNNKKKTIGIRLPNNAITIELSKLLGVPLAVTSLHIADEILEYPTDPELIFEENEHFVDVVVDGGIGKLVPSTIIDVTSLEPVVIREGLGSLDVLH
jgi:tRNA threonylcarbamoyl adenosine modification protein (Sua5/YciO/YrdC/YwlC family)